MKGKSRRRKTHQKVRMEVANPYSAGIDVGSAEHWVAVPEALDPHPVRSFGAYTGDLEALADWLVRIGVQTVAMESTGVYWIPLYDILESRGLEVLLIDARRLKNVSGRKSDLVDCQWIQQLHTFGLLSGAFRPPDAVCAARQMMRHRQNLSQLCVSHIQHMQKALTQMNVLLHQVVSDITGHTALRIIRAIADGERDPRQLAALRHRQCKNDKATIARALDGNYRTEHVFVLAQSLQFFEYYQQQIEACDQQLAELLAKFEDRAGSNREDPPSRQRKNRHDLAFDARRELIRITGVDLTRIPSIEAVTAMRIITEIGLDMSRWKTERHISSWAQLSPNHRISGGKVLSRKTKSSNPRVATILRVAAQSLGHSRSALGAYYRRLRARIGAPKAITAAARKLLCLIYRMLKYGEEYVEKGESYYEQKCHERALKNLQRRAAMLGYQLVEQSP